MVKKRGKKSRKVKARRAKSVKAKKVRMPKLKGAIKIADLLVSIGVLFALVNVAIILFGAKTITQNLAVQGILTSTGNWVALSIALLFLTYLVYTVNRMIRVTMSKRLMWGLLFLGVLMALGVYFGPPILVFPAALIIIAALTYLLKA